MKTISYSRQNITKSDIDSVIEVLKGDLITQGKYIELFENNLKRKFNAKYCSVVSSGTAALHLAGNVLKWKKNDIIITSPITFLASSNSILYSNSTPIFVDIDQKTYTIDCNKLEDKIKFLRKKNLSIKTVIGVDYAGYPCDWISLKYLSNKYNFYLINDNCHALGAEYKNDKYYASKYADLVIQSFHAVKNITTGEGGAIITNNKKMDMAIKILRSHGIKKRKSDQKKYGNWFYSMEKLGFNYRLTDFQAALGNNQLLRLKTIINKKKLIAIKYNKFFLKHKDFKIPFVDKNCKHAYHLYPLQFDFEKNKINKKLFFQHMIKNKIFLQVHYIPIYRQAFYKKLFNQRSISFPIAEKFYKNVFSLPIYSELKENEVRYVIKKMMEFIK